MCRNGWLFAILIMISFSAMTGHSQDGSNLPEIQAVAAVLDAFHEAASQADEELYFSFFAPEGVFMGTDASERWTVPEFREFAHPYFCAGKGWTLVPRDRFVYLGGADTVAWFDEKLDSASYGESRGSGVLRKIDGAWKVAHYNLTVPVPNDLLADLVRRIRGAEPEDTVVFIVRHAEKANEPGNSDPRLSDEGQARAARLARMLTNHTFGAAYATEYRRTQETVAPSAAAAGIEVTVRNAAGVEKLAKVLKTVHRGQFVLVSGHSNTVPALIQELGWKEKIVIEDGDYDDLFVVTLREGDRPALLHLSFGS